MKKIMTKEEFKIRWESDEDGGGISFGDVADCAREWGLSSNPKTSDMMKTLNTVLESAGIDPKAHLENEGEDY